MGLDTVLHRLEYLCRHTKGRVTEALRLSPIDLSSLEQHVRRKKGFCNRSVTQDLGRYELGSG